MIDVGDDPSEDPFNGPPGKLVVSSEDHPVGPYLTLSHRWGDADIIKLTKANLEELRLEIPMSLLSKTFKDAIATARVFGLRYLWIDSLCILQDSKEDWTREAATMCDVYKNSYCNIVAMSSKTMFDGLFFERDTSILKTHKVALGRPDREQVVYYLTVDNLLRDKEVKSAPLKKRGWVLQEELLAPRALLFTKQQILWECPTHEACEVYPGGVPDFYYWDYKGGSLLGSLPTYSHKRQLSTFNFSNEFVSGHLSRVQSRSYLRGAAHVDGFWYFWKDIVENFCERELTVKDDRLIALAGIATLLSRKTNYQYMAGIWDRGMFSSTFTAMELLWRTSFRGSLSKRPEARRAPSWSWASVDGDIRYFQDTDVDDLQNTASLSFRTEAGFLLHQNERIVLVIRGKLLELLGVREMLQPPDDSYEDYELEEMEEHPDFRNTPSDSVYCLSLFASYMHGDVWGLLLKRLQDGKYERSGYFDVNSKCANISWEAFNRAPLVTVEIV